MITNIGRSYRQRKWYLRGSSLSGGPRLSFWIRRSHYELSFHTISVTTWADAWWVEFSTRSPNVFKGLRFRWYRSFRK